MALIAASSLLLAVSCQKEMPGTVEVTEKGKSFTAIIDQNITKTTLSYDSDLNESKVLWENDDCININGSGYAATPLDPATKAIFKDKWWGEEPTAPYIAIFPASLHNGSGFEFPASQEYTAGKFNAPMYAESDTEVLPFRNICGVLHFALKGSDKVKRISVTANEALCGAFTVTGTTVTLTGTGKTVTLYCGQDGVQLDGSTPTDFYIFLPPRKYTPGMKITITNTEEDVFEKVTTADADIARSTVYSFEWDVQFSPVLTGKFSVGENQTVSFSQGNLHATKVSDNWIMGFYERQNEFNTIATVSGARTASSGDREIDLFTWGYGNTFTADPTTLSYGQVFSEWGTQIGSGSTWRTLTGDEWNYMLATRENASELYKSGVTVCGVEGCLVIAPDDFTGTIETSYDNAEWSTAEKTDGLVCLPPAGHRYGVGVGNTGRLGFYWASDQTDATNAKSLSLSKEGQSTKTKLYTAVPGTSSVGTYSDPSDQVNITTGNEDFQYYEVASTAVVNEWDRWMRQAQFYGVDDLSQIKNGSNCILKVKSKTETGCSVGIVPFLQGDRDAQQYQECDFPTLNLSEEWQSFEVQLTSNLDKVENLCFYVGNTEGKNVYLADIELYLTTSEQVEVHAAQGFPNGVGHAFGAEGLTCGETTVDDIHCFGMTNTAVGETYSAKYQIEFPEKTFEAGKKCRIRLKAKASGNKSITCYLVKSLAGQYPNCGTFPSVELTTTWQDFVIETNCTDSDATAIAFDFGDFEGSIYLAEFSVYKLVEIPYAASTEDGVGTAANDRKYGLSVRLVRDVNPAANLNSLNDNNDYGNLFD